MKSIGHNGLWIADEATSLTLPTPRGTEAASVSAVRRPTSRKAREVGHPHFLHCLCSGRGLYSAWLANQEERTAAGAVGSDHEGLLDVGGLGRSGDEDAETGPLDTDPIIGLVHIVDNLTRRHDQN